MGKILYLGDRLDYIPYMDKLTAEGHSVSTENISDKDGNQRNIEDILNKSDADILMTEFAPKNNGHYPETKLLEDIRKIYPTIPIIVISTEPRPEIFNHISKYSVNYIEHPKEQGDFLNTIGKHLANQSTIN